MSTRTFASLIVAAAATFAAHQAQAAIRVAVVANPSTGDDDTAAQLNDDTFYDFTATVVPVSDVDTAAELAAYDVVVFGDTSKNDMGFTQQAADALLAWHQAGGGIVGSGWVDYAIRGDAVDNTLDDLLPIDASPDGNNQYCNGSLTMTLAGPHPVTNGVSTLFGVGSANIEFNSLTPDGANAVVLGTAGGNFCTDAPAQAVVVGTNGSGRQVYLGLLYMAKPLYSTAGLRSDDADHLLENAVA